MVFWARAEKLYGQKQNALRWLGHTVPVKNMATGYGYITVVDAAMHTGCLKRKNREGLREWVVVHS